MKTIVASCVLCSTVKPCAYKGPTCATCYFKYKNKPAYKKRLLANSRNIRKINYIFTRLKREAKHRNLECSLTFAEFEELRKLDCFYCDGLLPEIGYGLDRIDNEKGYTNDNVLPCCKDCNFLRGNSLSVGETKTAVLAIKEHRLATSSRYFEEDVHLESRKVALFGEITCEKAAKFIKAFNELEILSAKPITIDLMSEGGSWLDALAIYDRIKSSKCEVIIVGYGLIASAASAIFQAGTHRLSMPHTTFLIHDGTEGFEGNAKDFESWATQSKKDREKLYNIYAERSGKPSSYWEEACKTDKFLTASEAVQLGLADGIIGDTE